MAGAGGDFNLTVKFICEDPRMNTVRKSPEFRSVDDVKSYLRQEHAMEFIVETDDTE